VKHRSKRDINKTTAVRMLAELSHALMPHIKLHHIQVNEGTRLRETTPLAQVKQYVVIS